MNALLLSAGFGTRLRPFTKKTPKCLMDVGGITILQYWLHKLLHEMGATKVFVNTHYLAEQVHKKIETLGFGRSVETCFEQEILGTAGTIISLADKLRDGGSFFVVHCDNYTTENLQKLRITHSQRPPGVEITAAAFNVDDTKNFGVFETALDGRVNKFVEKPPEGGRGLANAAIYCMNSTVIDAMIAMNARDLSCDFLPFVTSLTQVLHLDEAVIDIGTVENLTMVRKLNGQ